MGIHPSIQLIEFIKRTSPPFKWWASVARFEGKSYNQVVMDLMKFLPDK